MKALTTTRQTSFIDVVYHTKENTIDRFLSWIKVQEPLWEFNRLGITATGIFLQVTAAAAMISILAMADASLWIYGTGILFSFMANSIAFAQAPMRWVLGLFAASTLVNFTLALVYGMQLLN